MTTGLVGSEMCIRDSRQRERQTDKQRQRETDTERESKPRKPLERYQTEDTLNTSPV